MAPDVDSGEGSEAISRLSAIQEWAIRELLRRPHNWEDIRAQHNEEIRVYFSEKRDRWGDVVELDLEAARGPAFLPYEQDRRFHTVAIAVWRLHSTAYLLSAMAETLRKVPNDGDRASLRSALLLATQTRSAFDREVETYNASAKGTNPSFHNFVNSLFNRHLHVNTQLIAAIEADVSRPDASALKAFQKIYYDFAHTRYDWYRWLKYEERQDTNLVKIWERFNYLKLPPR